MQIIKDMRGEDMVYYDKPGEAGAALDNYLSGNWAALTSLEVASWRDCFEDPLNKRWQAAHAGMLLGITEEYVEGVLFVHRPCGETMEQSWAWLRRTVGPKPITHAELWTAIYFANNETKV